MLSCKTDDLVRNAGNKWQQRNARRKSRPERSKWHQHIEADRNQHHRHQEAGPAPRMERRILLYRRRSQRIAALKSEDRLVLGAMILIHPPDVLPQRYTPDE